MLGHSISHYRIIRELGKGAMGVVYLAEHIHLKRQVAIKTLRAEPAKQHYRQRFLREAQALSKIDHRNIARIYDYGETPEGQPFIVMELVQGHTIADYLSQKSFTLSRSLEVIGDVAKALAEAHRHGIIHRDIKPSNVIINERDEVKVLDFGLAKNIHAASPSRGKPGVVQPLLSTQTGESVIIGTPLYLSPEQALGLPVDVRSDIFSLGSLLYECVTDRAAFQGESIPDIRAKVIRDDPPLPSTLNPRVPPGGDQLILKLLAKKPDARYQSADEFLIALSALQSTVSEERSVSVSRLPPLAEADKGVRTSFIEALQRPRYLTAAFFIALAAGLLFWGALRLRPATPYRPSPEVARWYMQGTNALRDGTYHQASKMFEEAVKLDQRYALAHARLAESLSELGYTDKSASEMSRANVLVINDGLTLSETDALYLKAINAVTSRDFAAASAIYQQLLKQAPEGERAYLHVDLGRAFEKNEDPERSLLSYEEAMQVDSQYATAFLHAGILYGRRQDFPKAESTLNEAYRLYEAQTNMEGVTEALYQRGLLAISKGQAADAHNIFEKALDTARTINSTYQQARTLLQLSRVSSTSGQPEQAKQFATEAIRLAQTNNIHNLAAQGLIDLGNVHFVRSEIAPAEAYFKQALSLARAQNLRGGEARALLSLGSLYVHQDDAERGLEHVRQARPFYEQGGYRTELLQAQNLLGQAYDLKGSYGEALGEFEKQLQLAEQSNNKLQVALARKGMGTVLAHQERYVEALSHIDESYSIYNSLKIYLHAGYSLASRADVLWRLGRYEEARAALSQATAMAEQPDGKFKQLWGRLYVVSAPLALSEQDYQKAITEGRRAIALDDSETKHPSIETQYTVGLSQSRSGLAGEGLKTCEEAVALATRTGDPRLLAAAQLALAEAALISGDPTRALAVAKSAQALLERSGQVESEWRAWLIAGRAAEGLGDKQYVRECMLRADTLLSSLRQRWLDENYETYLNRPDVKLHRKHLREVSASARESG